MRAIAILLVLFSHCITTMNLNISNGKYNFLACSGKLGVSIFFVISGYLITKLLMLEKEKTGNISLKDFYLRRIFRIFPVFYLYIIVMILIKCFFIPVLFDNYASVVVAALYLWDCAFLFNIHVSAKVYSVFGHFWSLSVEEQFYLLWPITLVKLNIGTLKKALIGIILIMPFIRLAIYFFIPGSRGQADIMQPLEGGNTILIGCLGALTENTHFFKRNVLKLIGNIGLISITALVLFIISPLIWVHFKGTYNEPIGNILDGLCIVILLFWCIYIPSKISAILNSKVLVQIGILSYSLYVWQELFLFSNRKFHFWFNQFPLNIFLVFAIAFISYYLIERPILHLKKRFVRV